MKKKNVIFIFVALLGLFFNSFVSAAIQSYTLDNNRVLTEYSECNSSDSVGSFSKGNGVTIYVKKVPSHKWYNFWFDSSVNETLTCKTKDGIVRTIGVKITENAKVYNGNVPNNNGSSDNSSTNQNNANGTKVNGAANSGSTSTNCQYDCNFILGDINDSGISDNLPSVAYVLNKILFFMKLMGPILVIVLTILDLVKAVTSADKDALSKCLKTLSKRMVYAVLLFVFPTVIDLILKWTNVYGTCCIFGN